ncbi:hypothetical protein Tco_0553791 [Tanacetum coccineum]
MKLWGLTWAPQIHTFSYGRKEYMTYVILHETLITAEHDNYICFALNWVADAGTYEIGVEELGRTIKSLIENEIVILSSPQQQVDSPSMGIPHQQQARGLLVKIVF